MTLTFTLTTFAILLAGTVSDLRSRLVPDAVPVLLLVTALVAAIVETGTSRWMPLVLGGLAAAALGAALFRLGGFGGGDVKVLAGLGCVVGLDHLASLLFFVAVAGGVVALVCVARGTRDLPYLPAITLGYAAFGLWGRP